MKSLREKVIDLLMENDGLTAKEICNLLELEPSRIKEIYSMIEEIARIVRRKGFRLMVVYPKCKDCGFELRKIKASRCPKCKSERIEHAKFTIK